MATLNQSHPRILAIAVIALLMIVALVLQLTGANPASSQAVTLVALQSSEDPGTDPGSDAWSRARRVEIPLSGQLAVYSAGGGTTPSVSARALHYNDTLYVRVEWADATEDGSTLKVEDFSDAVAVEFPASSATSVPSFCMGQAGSGVNIWHWRADSQSPEHDPALAYSNALVDMYPASGDLWYTARAAGNPVARLDGSPVQTLVAEMFGTLSPAAIQNVQGSGVYQDSKWAVVFSRPFATSDQTQASFKVGTETDMALAVWNGSEGERNGQKSVSTFIKLRLDAASASSSTGGDSTVVTLVIAATVVLGLAFLAFGWFGYRQATGRRAA